MASLSVSTTWSSTYRALCSAPAQFGFMAAASMSAKAPTVVPEPLTQPQERGWMLPR